VCRTTRRAAETIPGSPLLNSRIPSLSPVITCPMKRAQGQFDDTITLMTGDAAQSLGVCPRLILAMALHQPGRKEEARSSLEEAIRQFDWTPLCADHPDVWIAHILRLDAEALIFPDPPTSLEGKE
jgi:hypothetical protein